MSVKWTASYDINTSKNEHFKILVSDKNDGSVYASCLWYEGDRVLKAPGQEGGGLRFDLKTVLGSSAEDAYQQLVVWAKDKFGQDITISESS